MKRRQLIGGALAVFAVQVLAAMPVSAATFAEQIVTQLRQQGFQNIISESTWLGRVRIAAERADVSREIVLNPVTGEILRDFSTLTSGAEVSSINIGNNVSDDESENHGHGDDDDGDDDSGDNSGSGSGGSGGSGSGKD